MANKENVLDFDARWEIRTKLVELVSATERLKSATQAAAAAFESLNSLLPLDGEYFVKANYTTYLLSRDAEGAPIHREVTEL